MTFNPMKHMQLNEKEIALVAYTFSLEKAKKYPKCMLVTVV